MKHGAMWLGLHAAGALSLGTWFGMSEAPGVLLWIAAPMMLVPVWPITEFLTHARLPREFRGAATNKDGG